MTANDIRAEAIERIARKIYTDATPSSLLPTWEQANETKREAFLRMAGEYVDALGDLLPTGVEWGHYCGGFRCEPDIPCTQSGDKTLMPDGNLFRRYTTSWHRIEGAQ